MSRTPPNHPPAAALPRAGGKAARRAARLRARPDAATAGAPIAAPAGASVTAPAAASAAAWVAAPVATAIVAALLAAAPAAAQPGLLGWIGSNIRSARPALAPTTDGGTSDTRADGTAVSPVPRIVIAPTRPVTAATTSDDEGAATLLADRVDLAEGRVLTASGGVVIWFQGARLVAERVVYNGDAGTMAIDGPIHLTEPAKAGTQAETVLIADSAQLDEGLRDGLLKGARLVLARELQLAATEVRRTGQGRMTTLTHVVASSCQVCADDPTPLWEIRARSVTHDAVTRRIQFDRPQFRAFGLPLATLPALSAPDPTVDRMSGFLAPQFRTTSGLGFGVKLPYFLTLGDSADVTLTPYVSASRTATLGLRYRQAFANGATEWNGAISRDDIRDGTRGYLFGAAAFQLPRDYRLGVQVQTASDRAYLLDYDITDADRLWSGVTLDRVKRDRLLTARIGRYETLREAEDAATSAGLVGDALWERRFTPAGLGGEAGLQLSAHAHRRSSGRDIAGRDMARASARADWNRNWILPGGVVAAAQTRLDADLYSIRDDSRFDASEARAYPTAGVELRWPLISHAGAATNLLEPVAQIVWSPRVDDSDKVPDEDSRLIEFDEGNLFALDRTPGRDGVEGGLRANLGLTWTRIDPTGWSLGLTAGRVLREHPDSALAAAGEILSEKRSDWLMAATYDNSQGLALASRALFDDDFSIHRSETRLGWLTPGFQLSAGYLWIDAATEEGRSRDVSELTATTGWQLAQGWWADAETRYDFIADRAQTAEMGVAYRNECVSVDLSVSRRFTSSDNLRPDTDVGLSVRLGGFGRPPGDAAPGTVARRACVR